MSIFQLGFRTFYSLAAIFAIAAMILWLRVFAGLSGTGEYLYGVVWHSHEMLFGFAVAVIAGFLLTAVRNWTGLPTPTGAALAALAAIWLAARVLIILGSAPLAAIVDAAFLPALAFAIAGPILGSKNKRNYKVLAIILLLALSHGVFHLASLGYAEAWVSRTALFVSIDIVIILMALVGGRVIPAFTRNALPSATSRHEPWVEIITFASMILIIATGVLRGSWTTPPTRIFSACTCSNEHRSRRRLDSRRDHGCRQRANARDDDAQLIGPHGPTTRRQQDRHGRFPTAASRCHRSGCREHKGRGDISTMGCCLRPYLGIGISGLRVALPANAQPTSSIGLDDC